MLSAGESRFSGFAHSCVPGQRHIINWGSVGRSRNSDPRASFALLDTDNDIASIIRVPYDIAKTADAIRAAGLPEFLAKRLTFGI